MGAGYWGPQGEEALPHPQSGRAGHSPGKEADVEDHPQYCHTVHAPEAWGAGGAGDE